MPRVDSRSYPRVRGQSAERAAPPCERERRRQTGLANSPAVRADIRAKLSAALRGRQWQAGEPLRALAPAAFGVLPARDLDVVQLYYGLDDGEPLTSGEIGDRLGVRADRVRQLVCQSVARLLGPNAERVLGKGRSGN